MPFSVATVARIGSSEVHSGPTVRTMLCLDESWKPSQQTAREAASCLLVGSYPPGFMFRMPVDRLFFHRLLLRQYR